jgi:sugar lactone lactonase YvrE
VSARVISGSGVELFLDARAELGEGPVWDDRGQELWWVDVSAGRAHRCSPAGHDRVALQAREAVGSVALTEADGAVVVATGRDLVLLHPSGDTSHLVTVGDVVRTGVLNDCKCDPAGNLWVDVSTEAEAEPIGCLRVVTPSFAVTTVLDGLTVPNGVDWSPDGRWMYFADSPTSCVDAFPVHDERPGPGRLGQPTTLASVEPGQGIPDGLTVDSEGAVWVAYWEGWRVSRYLPDGTLDAVVELPVAKVTSCTFGGQDLRELYVTTAAYELSPQERRAQPAAGGIFRVRVDTPGLPARRFTPRTGPFAPRTS